MGWYDDFVKARGKRKGRRKKAAPSPLPFGAEEPSDEELGIIGPSEELPGVSRRTYYGYGDYYGGYSYDFTGRTRGYFYYEPPLSEEYIDQLVTGLASEYKVKVVRGDSWGVDLDTRELQYDPASLVTTRKADVIAAILHEIGHLRYSTSYSKMASPWWKKYEAAAKLAYNLFEDFRIDKLTEADYEGAEDIFEANRKIVLNGAADMREKATEVRVASFEMLAKLKEKIDTPLVSEFFGTRSVKQATSRFEQMLGMAKEPHLFEYLAEISLLAYGRASTFPDPQLDKYVKPTTSFTEEARGVKVSAEVLSGMDVKVYPLIEPLLRNYKGDKYKEIDGGAMASQALKKVIERTLLGGSPREATGGSKMAARFLGGGVGSESAEHLPRKSYQVVKNSVREEIERLRQLILKLRLAEATSRFVHPKRSGIVMARRLYRHRLADPRLFKKRIMQVEKTRAFAFSLWVDMSGSMGSDTGYKRAEKALETAIILAEAATKCGIPVEVLGFDSEPHILKRFSDDLSRSSVQRSIAKISDATGGTNIAGLFYESGIKAIAKPFRAVFVITDGEVHNPKAQTVKFRKWQAEGIHSYQVEIESDAEALLDDVVSVTDVKKLPRTLGSLLLRSLKV